MPEKVTPLNGLKVTLLYWCYNIDAHNVNYVKFNLFLPLCTDKCFVMQTTVLRIFYITAIQVSSCALSKKSF